MGRRQGEGGLRRPFAHLGALCVLAVGTMGAWHPALSTDSPTRGTQYSAPDTRHPAPILPSQVLVLYNADWTGDAPLTDPGQDSQEIAAHYVRRNTDPATGDKPYLLGLRCVHGKNHLNTPDLAEDSKDNAAGVVLRRGGKVAGSAGEMRDSRGVELVLPKAQKPWRFETLRVELRPHEGAPLVLVEGGKSLHGARVAVQAEGEWHVRADGRSFVQGPFVARAQCEDAEGTLHRWEAEYEDVLDVSCSRTGPDGIRDDRNYLDDVESQVKAFLEDPENARPDGTLLKDHVLFLVTTWGLPRAARATYGIARGVTAARSDHGPLIALDQRLQLLYYDVEGALGFVPRTHRFNGGGPFTAYLYRAPQAWPLHGPAANPFLHSRVYEKDALTQGDALPFTSDTRRRFPGRHLYFVTRIDAMTPLEARGLIDRAAYFSQYGPPPAPAADAPSSDVAATPANGRSDGTATAFLRNLGVHHLGMTVMAGSLVEFLPAEPRPGLLNGTKVYFPGGIAAGVISKNGWDVSSAPLRDHLARGVTATAASARATAGQGPHIHNKSWWDDKVLYPCLAEGLTLGECLLRNQIHLEWVTAYAGDPLMRWPLSAAPDTTPPAPDWEEEFRLAELPGPEGTRAVWVRVGLRTDTGGIETAQMQASLPHGPVGLCQTFEAAPYAMLGAPDEVYGKHWRFAFVDPFGNRTEAERRIERQR
jgi:hypothetical protein